MSETNLIQYAVGALLIIAGAALIYIGQPTPGLAVIGIGLSLLGYQYGYGRGVKKGLSMPRP